MFGTAKNRAAPTDKQWRALGEYLGSDSTRLLLVQERRNIHAEWNDINEQEEALDDAILIGLVGGTGVGKSTFINALAAAEISHSSDRRPTTSRVVVYRNVATELPAEVPTKHLTQPQILHEKPELSKVILFDFPDFDSAERSHAEILAEYLPHLDVIFVVVDDVKYADRRLYDLLSELKVDKGNLFVLLNKIDRLQSRYEGESKNVISEIHGDLRQMFNDHAQITIKQDQQFAIAARQVLDARLQGNSTANEASFNEIERLLESYRQEKHRKIVKERNLDARKQGVIETVQHNALGEENRQIINETQELVSKWRSETEQACAAIPVEILSERERQALRKRRLRRAGARWGFPISLFITLMSEFRRMRGSADASQPANVGARILHHYRAFFESLGNLKARIASEVAGTALAQSSPRPEAGKLAEVASSPEALTNRLGSDFEAQIGKNDGRPRRMRRHLCHLPALLVLGLAVWSRIYGVVDPTDDRGFFQALAIELWNTISPTFLVGLVLSIAFAYLVTAIFAWAREIQILEGEIADQEQKTREDIRRYGDQVIQSIDIRVQALNSEFEKLSKVVQ